MLSVIVCSRSQTPKPDFAENIRHTIGVEYELIHIDNSVNTYSIFEAYNQGYKISKYPYLCFVHDDIFFHSKDWGKKLIMHLQDPSTGVIGIAGADLVHRVPSAWTKVFGPSQNVLQTDTTGKKEPEHKLLPLQYQLDKRTTVTLDGMILAMRKDLMDHHIRFDENMQGFHGYDYDISIQSTVAGFQNYVIYDILLEHFSGGKTNQTYFNNLIYIYKKFETQLPLIGQSITPEQKAKINKLEKKNLNQLMTKMVRKGFSVKALKSSAGYFSERIQAGKPWVGFTLKILFLRLFNAPKYLLHK